jgi:hypothetical protein
MITWYFLTELTVTIGVVSKIIKTVSEWYYQRSLRGEAWNFQWHILEEKTGIQSMRVQTGTYYVSKLSIVIISNWRPKDNNIQ